MLKFNETTMNQIMNASDNEGLAHLFANHSNHDQSKAVVDGMLNTFDSDYTETGFINETNPHSFKTYQRQVMAIYLAQSNRLFDTFKQSMEAQQLARQPFNLETFYSEFAIAFERDMSMQYQFDGEAVLDTAIRNLIHQIAYQGSFLVRSDFYHDVIQWNQDADHHFDMLNNDQRFKLAKIWDAITNTNEYWAYQKFGETMNQNLYAWEPIEQAVLKHAELKTAQAEKLVRPVTNQTMLTNMYEFKTDYNAVINY